MQIFEKIHLWWGYTRMHATGTSLKIEAITNSGGTVFDTLTLRKPEGWGHDWHADSGGPPAPRPVCFPCTHPVHIRHCSRATWAQHRSSSEVWC